MTAFEFVFPLFGLLVGLSYTEMLAGLARILKSSHRIRIGWLIPALGLLVLINLTIFWFGTWQMRGMAAPTMGALLLILLIGGLYFLAASLIFPNPGEEGTDLDAHFFATRRRVIGAIAFCNIFALALVASEAEWRMTPLWWIANSLFLALLAAAALAPGKRVVLGALAIMIAMHAIDISFG